MKLRYQTPPALIVLTIALLLFVAIALIPRAHAQGQVSVSAADPMAAEVGTINLNVKVTGKGFKNGAKAKWFVTGTTDTGGVTVNSTTFVSSGEVTANITVADTAAITTFDIQVTNSDGRGGKGTELFNVTAKANASNNNCPAPPPAPISDTKCYAALPGCLDSTFGGVGYVHTNPNQSGGGYAVEANGVTVQPDGKIVVAGDERTVAANRNYAILRYNTDGSLDTSFGDLDPFNGSLRRGYIVIAPSTGYDSTNDVLLQPDGKIVFSGAVNTTSGAVVRLNTNGTLDTSFGNGGIVQLGSGEAKKGLAIQSDGKIVVGGGAGGFSLTRLNPNGSLDLSFGSGGKVFANPGYGKHGTSTAWDVAIQRVPAITGEERLVLVGYSSVASNANSGWTVMRFRSNGATDTSFGTNGITKTFFYGFQDQARVVKIDSSNRIVVAGLVTKTSCDDAFDFGVVRYTQNGSIDGSFLGGPQTVDVYGGDDTLNGLEIQTDGKVLLSGTSYSGDNTVTDFALVRFNSDGSRDSSFGLLGNGIVTTDLFGKGDYAFAGLALQPDGKIITGGGTYLPNVTPGEIAVARYLP